MVIIAREFAVTGLRLIAAALPVDTKLEHDVDVSFDFEGISVTLLSVDLSEPGLPALESLASRVEAFVQRAVPA